MQSRRLYALTYDYVSDIRERREPVRDAHLANLAEWHERGELLVAGALGDPPHGAFFAFDVEDPARVERYVASDPYVEAGLITAHRIEPWTVVAGP
jgi:uncharacterized protein YciI